ncbi:hypothetical protein ACVWYF_003511 [Hymenobacter sp. UYAg731]
MILCARHGLSQSLTKAKLADFFTASRSSLASIHNTWICRDDKTFNTRDSLVFHNTVNYNYLTQGCTLIAWNILSKDSLRQSINDYCHEPPEQSVAFDGSNKYRFSIEEIRGITYLNLTNFKGKSDRFKVIYSKGFEIGSKEEYAILTLVRLKKKRNK